MSGFVTDYRPLADHRTRAPKWEKAVHDPELVRLVAEGWTDREIGQELGYEAGVIRTRRCSLGLPVNREPAKKLQKDAPARMVPEKPNPIDLAARYLPGFDRESMTVTTARGRTPIRLQDAIRQTNAILKARGEPQVGPRELHA